jgi:hypothetical protein
LIDNELNDEEEKKQDAPINHKVRQRVETDFSAYFHHNLSARRSPSDQLLGRVEREVRKGTFNAIKLSLVKSLHHSHAEDPGKSIRLAAGMTFKVDTSQEQHFASFFHIMKSLSVLLNAYLLIGFKKQVEPGLFWSTKDGLDAYCEFIEEKGEQMSLAAVLEGDQKVRERVAELLRQKKERTFDSALEKAMNEKASYFLPTRIAQARTLNPPAPQLQPPKRPPPEHSPPIVPPPKRLTGAEAARAAGEAPKVTVRKGAGGKEFCKRWNDQRGCTNASCPHLHQCDVRMPNGQACGDPGHNRAGHPSN